MCHVGQSQLLHDHDRLIANIIFHELLDSTFKESFAVEYYLFYFIYIIYMLIFSQICFCS